MISFPSILYPVTAALLSLLSSSGASQDRSILVEEIALASKSVGRSGTSSGVVISSLSVLLSLFTDDEFKVILTSLELSLDPSA